eukprot:NODE_1419_length_1108_cov_1.102081.p2 type:complete len:166 gc:universal NODE_1419_length_1108_cov_1.102081:372-869(+)
MNFRLPNCSYFSFNMGTNRFLVNFKTPRLSPKEVSQIENGTVMSLFCCINNCLRHFKSPILAGISLIKLFLKLITSNNFISNNSSGNSRMKLSLARSTLKLMRSGRRVDKQLSLFPLISSTFNDLHIKTPAGNAFNLLLLKSHVVRYLYLVNAGIYWILLMLECK